MNYNFELAIKDSYFKIQEFEEIKEFLHILIKMMKDSGKAWYAFLVVSDCLGVKFCDIQKLQGLVSRLMCSGFVEFSEEFLAHANICRKCSGTGFRH